MGTMRTGNLVNRAQHAAHADGDTFLANARVYRTVDAILCLELQQCFLESTDQYELLQHPKQLVGWLSVPIAVVDDKLDERCGAG